MKPEYKPFIPMALIVATVWLTFYLLHIWPDWCIFPLLITAAITIFILWYIILELIEKIK